MEGLPSVTFTVEIKSNVLDGLVLMSSFFTILQIVYEVYGVCVCVLYTQ